MPLFDFQCTKYAYHKFEELCKSDEVVICPECGYVAKKMISAANFKINGHSEANGYHHKPHNVDKYAPKS